MTNFVKYFKLPAITITSIILASCGGGDDGDDPITNSAPAFPSSSAAVNFAENSTDVVYTASATDAEGNTITYALSGGDDQDQFSIGTSSGALQFKSPPDHENPSDDGGNNVYEVEISASDSSASSKMTLEVTVTNVVEDGEDGGSVGGDTTPPTEPRLISLASADASSIDVDWIGSSDDYTGSALIEYQIHAATTSGFTPDSSTLQSSVNNTISATISGLGASTEYFVVVLAVDEAGNQSSSQEKSVTTSASAAIASDEAVAIEADAITTVADDSLTLEKTSATEALQADDILVSDQDDGLLLKVESVADNGSELEVTTTQATLVDAFEQVEFNLLTTLEDIDTDLETQGLFPTGQSARGLSSPTLRSNQSSQELRWPSGLRLQQEDLSAQSSTLSLQPALAVSSEQAIDESGSGTLASAYEVYATSSDAVISFDVVLEIESGHSFDDIEVDISHNTLSTPNYEVIKKSSNSSRKEYRIQWDNSGATSTAPFEVDISAQEQDCWVLCTLSVRTEAYVLDADKDSLFDDEYTFEASNSSGSAKVTASAGIGFSPDFDVFVQIDGFEVEHALTQVTGELKLENTLQFLASQSSEVEKTKTLFSKKFTKIIMAGTVPIVISGRLQLDGQLSGNISGEVNLDAIAESSLTVSAGVEYKDGEFTYIDDAETTYKFEVIGDAGATIAGELRLIPELDISFYRVAGAEMTLEPYVFSEATLEGQFKAIVDNNFADATANYRFSELQAGIAMDASITAKFGIILDNRTIGVEATWNNNGDAVLGPYYLITLPSAEISALSAASPANGLLLGLETTSGTLGFVKDNRVINGYWQVYPEDSSTAFSASGSGARFDYSTDAEYELRYVYYSDLGSFIRQYEDFDVDLSDSDNDGLNNQYENFYSFLDPDNPLDADDDHDNDGYDNLSEYQNGSDPSSSSSYPGDGSTPADALPSDFTATAGNEQVTLEWTRYAASTVYNIYRSDNPNCDLININTCSTAAGQSELFSNVSSPFTDTGLTNATTYYYWIEAIHDGEVQLAEDYVRATLQATDAGFAINEDDYQTIYTHSDGTIYAVTKDSMNWDDARAMAQEQGGDLVTIHSEEENQLVAELLDGATAWLGASDDGDRIPGAFETTASSSQDGWRWVDGSEFNYENWHGTNEPNDSGTEDCMQMNYGSQTDGSWNDKSCSQDFYAVFEFVPESQSIEATALLVNDSSDPDTVSAEFQAIMQEAGEVTLVDPDDITTGNVDINDFAHIGCFIYGGSSSVSNIDSETGEIISSWLNSGGTLVVNPEACGGKLLDLMDLATFGSRSNWYPALDDSKFFTEVPSDHPYFQDIAPFTGEPSDYSVDYWDSGDHDAMVFRVDNSLSYTGRYGVDDYLVDPDRYLAKCFGTGWSVGSEHDCYREWDIGSGSVIVAKDLLWTFDQANQTGGYIGIAGRQFLHNMVGSNTSELSDGLVAHYEFEDNANDSSGNDNHGEVVGASLTTDRFGIADSAYYFDGNNDRIEVAHSDSLNISKHITLSAWVYTENGGPNNPRIISKDYLGSHSGYELYTDEVGSNSYRKVGTSTAGDVGLQDVGLVYFDRWHFVATTYDGERMVIFVDGVEVGSVEITSEISTNSYSLWIGDRRHNSLDDFQGKIDDVRIYNRALSAAEIQALYELGESEDHGILIFQEDYSSYSTGSLPEDYVIVYNGQGNSQQYIDSDGDEKWLRTAGAYNWDLAMRKDFEEHLTGNITVEWDMQAAGTSDPSADHGYLAKFSLKGVTLHAGITIDHHNDDDNDYASCSSADLDADDRPHMEVTRKQWNTYRMDIDFDSGRFDGYVNDELLCSQHLMSEADLSSTWNRLSEDSSIVFESKNSTSTITLFDNIKIWQ